MIQKTDTFLRINRVCAKGMFVLMRTKIDELKEKAKTTIISKILGEKDDKKIEPYKGDNAFYSSSDEEYEEFLKNLNIITADAKDDKEVFSVDNTQSFKLSQKKQESTLPKDTNEQCDDTSDDDLTKYQNTDDDKIFTIMTSIERLTNIVENNDIRREHTLDKVLNELSNLKQEIEEVKKEQLKIQNNVSPITKVSDSVFDIKNTQQTTKNSITNLEASFNRMKNKYIACITLLSVLSFIIIALQVLNLLSL